VDYWRTHRPSRDLRRHDAARSRPDPGPGLFPVRQGLSRFYLLPTKMSYSRRINLFMRSIARAPHSEDGKLQGLDLNQQLTGSEPVVLPIELPWKKSVAEAGLEPARPHGTPGSEPGASAIPPLGPFVSPTTLGGI
jgi:hypothetical protein